MDIYATEFMRMFEHYWFRFKLAQIEKKTGALPANERAIGLREDASWSDPFYKVGSKEMLDRQAFAGIVV